jgi:NAD(P)-dependent dehydrogenase (short-subunit alcohol dehydrogenase family)
MTPALWDNPEQKGVRMFSFKGRIVLVTGAAGNLGYAVAEAFLSAEANLVLVDHAPDRLPKVFPELVDVPNHLLATSVDVGNESTVQAMVDRVMSHFGRIDVLVNTVGGYRAGTPIHSTPLKVWDSMLNLNARTAFIISRAVAPAMRTQAYGKIVHVASRAALKGGARAAAYSASKSALVRLTESLSAELKRTGINVNCVMPGTIDTPSNRQEMPKADHSRWVAPKAVADAILFLASDAARAIHGTALPVYGTG